MGFATGCAIGLESGMSAGVIRSKSIAVAGSSLHCAGRWLVDRQRSSFDIVPDRFSQNALVAAVEGREPKNPRDSGIVEGGGKFLDSLR